LLKQRYVPTPHPFDSVDHESHRKRGIWPFPRDLYVVTVVSNPFRYRSRNDLYWAFENMVDAGNAYLVTVELAYGDRHFEVTEPGNPFHLQLRTKSELWHKENLINLGIQHVGRINPAWQYVAWIDADVAFARPDWAQETLQRLQHHQMIQMFSHAQDLGPEYEPLQQFRSFMSSYVNGNPRPRPPIGGCYPYDGGHPGDGTWAAWHPGYAWAARREAIDHLGGLIDISILGSADNIMANALVGKVDDTIHPKILPNFRDYCHEWQGRALKFLQRNVGYMPGLLLHYWHGKKKDRKYLDRWKILTEERFDYQKDLKFDSQGVLQLTDRNFRLRDRIRQYFLARNEDTIEVG
jgi:hypothetical protein